MGEGWPADVTVNCCHVNSVEMGFLLAGRIGRGLRILGRFGRRCGLRLKIAHAPVGREG